MLNDVHHHEGRMEDGNDCRVGAVQFESDDRTTEGQHRKAGFAQHWVSVQKFGRLLVSALELAARVCWPQNCCRNLTRRIDNPARGMLLPS